MSTTVDLSGLGRLADRLRKISHPSDGDFNQLMTGWSKIVDDDNRRGVLAGTDKDGYPMVPVTYRPEPKPGAKPTRAQKNNPRKGQRRGEFRGLGPAPAGINNNLTPDEYRRLAGPPLAPRGAFSRVVTNLKFRWGESGAVGLLWTLVGYWDEVVNVKGERFLHYHFDGATGGGKRRNVTLPRRDLRGVRPEGVRKAGRALRAWALDLIRSA